MSTANDRRAPHAMRIPFDATVEVGGALGPTFEAHAVNLSEEGMHLRTMILPEVGQPMTCRFEAGDGLEVVAAGEVLWREDLGEQGEFGIRFTNLTEQSAEALHRILQMAQSDQSVHGASSRKVRLHIEGLAAPMRARVREEQGPSVTAFSELGFLQVGKAVELEDAVTGRKKPALIHGVDIEVEQESHVPRLIVRLRYEEPALGVAHAGVLEAGEEPLVMRHAGAEAQDAYAYDSDEPLPPHGAAVESVYGASGASEAVDAGAALHVESVSVRSDGEGLEADRHDEEVRALRSGTLAAGASRVAEGLASWTRRARMAASRWTSMVPALRGRSSSDAASPARRTTAPAPGGGLHAFGRRVVRGDANDVAAESVEEKRIFSMSRKRLAVVGGAIAATSVVTIVALCKGSDETAGASATSNVAPMGQAVAVDMSSTSDAGVAPLATATTELTMAPGVAAVNANLNASPTSAAGSLAMPQAAAPTATPNANSTGGVNAGLGVATVVDEKMTLVQDAAPEPKAVPVKVTPFSNGTVARGNVLKLKMDGAVESIQGASQPSGFTVVIPNRKSLEPAGPLAAQDARIAAMRVTNEAGGAELTVAFKDGVPNYQVKARGDVLEIHLAKPGQVGNKAPEAHARPHAPTKKTKHAETPVRGKHGT